jgi:hypothetical protein
MLRALGLGLVAIATTWLPSSARAEPPVVATARAPSLEVHGGTVRDRRLTGRCTADHACELELTFEVVAGDREVVVSADGDTLAAFTVDAPAEAVKLHVFVVPAGTSARARLATRLSVPPPRERYSAIFDAFWLRHVLLAPRAPRTRRWEPAGAMEMTLAAVGATLDGPVQLAVALDPGIALEVDDEATAPDASVAGGHLLVVRFPDRMRSRPPTGFRRGGPFVALGKDMTGDGEHPWLARAGYEVGVGDWLVPWAGIETDFEHRAAVSAVVEVATPALSWFVVQFPSLFGGAGVVFDAAEGGVRRAGFRLTAGASVPALSVRWTFDRYPSDGEWRWSLVGQLSL